VVWAEAEFAAVPQCASKTPCRKKPTMPAGLHARAARALNVGDAFHSCNLAAR